MSTPAPIRGEATGNFEYKVEWQERESAVEHLKDCVYYIRHLPAHSTLKHNLYTLYVYVPFDFHTKRFPERTHWLFVTDTQRDTLFYDLQASKY
jgi:hypothetical protein